MKLVTNKFKSGGLHWKHVVAWIYGRGHGLAAQILTTSLRVLLSVPVFRVPRFPELKWTSSVFVVVFVFVFVLVKVVRKLGRRLQMGQNVKTDHAVQEEAILWLAYIDYVIIHCSNSVCRSERRMDYIKLWRQAAYRMLSRL